MHTLMLLGLGFLSASLIAFLLAPFLWRYAVHATKQHIRQTSPLTMGEIQADRDQLRAEHALIKRKLEMEGEKLGAENKKLKIEIAELKKSLREITQDISSHGAEIKTKESLLADLAKERDQLKNILISKDLQIKETQSNYKKEKTLSARTASALKDANGLAKTKDEELKNLQKTIDKQDKQLLNNGQKLKLLEGHISRHKTCSGAVKSLSDELISLEKECEKFLRAKFTRKRDFTSRQKKLLKGLDAFATLEKSVRKQWTIASKAERGGRSIFASLKQQIDYLKSSATVLKKIIEKAEYGQDKPGRHDPKPPPQNIADEDISKRIRSLQDKLSA